MFYCFVIRSDETVERMQGIDGVRYLHLSEHLMVTMVVITVCCTAIIIPINLTGERGQYHVINT